MTQDEALTIPKKGAPADEIRHFLDRVCDRDSTKRREFECELLENKAYFEGYQWLQRWKGDPRKSPRFVKATSDDRNGIPMPVTNEILGPVDNEVARLAKRNSETYVDPSDQSPEAKAGAKVANDAMESHLREIRWPRIRRKGIFQDVLYGTMILESFLEQDNLDTVKVGLTGPKGEPVAHRCCGGVQQPDPIQVGAAEMLGAEPPQPIPTPPCGFKTAKPQFDGKQLGLVPPPGLGKVRITPTFDFKQNKPMDAEYSAEGCLCCGGEIEPFVPSLSEAHEKDHFGRPLGQDVPKNCAKIQVLSPLEFFPFNEGLGQEPETLEGYGFANAKSVSWIKRYYRKNTDQVKREDASLVAECTPILGEYESGAKGATSAGTRPIYQDYVRHRGYVLYPTMDYPRGRFIAMAGNIVVADDDLLVDPEPVEGKAPGKPFPRRKVAMARCFIKDGEIWGQGAPVHAKSLQNRINMTNSQMVDAREHTVGGILASRGMKLIREWVRGFAGYIFRYDADPNAPQEKPTPFKTGQPDTEAIKEIEYATDRIGAVLGVSASETGGVPAPGVTAASAIQFAAEKASERRQQREKELIDAFEEIFEHQLLLIQKYYREEDARTYQVKAAAGWEKREFYGAQINGETGIKIREQPAYDVKMAEREAMWQMQQQGILPLDDADAIREFAKIMGAPMSIIERSNRQLDAAGRKWFNFLRLGVKPEPDQNLDDHAIYYQTYGKQMLSEEGVELAEKSQWDVVLKSLWGWEKDLQAATLLMERAATMGWTPGMPIQQFQQQAYQMDVQGYEQGKAQLDAAVQQGAQAPMDVPPPPQPPKIFANPNPPPEPLADLILWIWEGRCLERGAPLTPQQKHYAGFRAAYETHRLLAEQESAAMMQGQAQAPAPGAPVGPQPMAA